MTELPEPRARRYRHGSMVMETAFRSEERFTRQEYWKFLESLPAAQQLGKWELLGGRITVSPPARWRRGAVAATVTRVLGQHVRENALGLVFESSAGFDLPTGDTVQPDSAFVTAERLRAAPLPEATDEGFPPVVPSLVVEVPSPSTRRRDRTEKARIYARSAIDEYWLIDPARRTVTVRTLVDGAYSAGPSIVRGDIRSRVLPGLRVTVRDVFADVDAYEP